MGKRKTIAGGTWATKAEEENGNFDDVRQVAPGEKTSNPPEKYEPNKAHHSSTAVDDTDPWFQEDGELPTKSTALLLVVVLLVCVACYWNSLNGDFVFDDFVAVVENKDVLPATSLEKVFTSDFWGCLIADWQSHKSYRPLTILSFRLSYIMAGEQFARIPFHAVNLVGHSLVSVLVYYVSRASLGFGPPKDSLSRPPKCSPAVAATTALLYASHPIHTDAVSSIVSRSEVLSGLFYMLSYLVYVRAVRPAHTDWFWVLVSIFCFCVALLFKELGITVVAMLVAHDLVRVVGVLPRFRAWMTAAKVPPFDTDGSPDELNQDENGVDYIVEDRTNLEPNEPGGRTVPGPQLVWPQVGHSQATLRLLVVVTVFVVVFYFRLKLNGGNMPNFKQVENPTMFAEERSTRVMTFNWLLVLNIRQLVYPVVLMADYSNTAVPLITELSDPRNVGTVTMWLVLIYLICRSLVMASGHAINSALLMSLGFLIVPFLPSTNLIFPVGFVVAERVLYIPSLGFCMLCALLLDFLRCRGMLSRTALAAIVAVVVSMYTARCVIRNFDWSEQSNFWAAMMRDYPDSAKGHFGYANLLSRAPERENDAMDMLHKAATLFPDYWDAYNNLGDMYTRRREFAKAAEMFDHTLRIHPVRYESQYNRALAHINMKEYEQAFLAIDGMIEWFPTNVDLYQKLGIALHGLEMYQDELDAISTLIELEPHVPNHHIDYGKLAGQLGRLADAEDHFRQALSIAQYHPDALFNLAGLLMEKGQMHRARKLFVKVAQIAPYFPRLQDMLDMTEDSTGLPPPDDHNQDQDLRHQDYHSQDQDGQDTQDHFQQQEQAPARAQSMDDDDGDWGDDNW
mmetsp:Transcript_22567/g.52590  ORF Transcript_22567/g.52590 Transcript_22567/m.52590 type:complete len:851 (-) Transcript_22567:99-2651(-)